MKRKKMLSQDTAFTIEINEYGKRIVKEKGSLYSDFKSAVNRVYEIFFNETEEKDAIPRKRARRAD